MSTIISLLGRKGGITKTTLAASLAAACARAGMRTVLVDADGQGNATQMVGAKRAPGMSMVMLRDAEWADVLVPVGVEFTGYTEHSAPLWVLPSDDSQRELEQHPQAAARISERLNELHSWTDVVIVDTSPGISEVHAGVYFAADWALLPTTMEWAAISSLANTLTYLGAAQRSTGGQSAGLLGIIPNMFSAGEKVQRENYGYLRGKYEPVCRVFEPMRRLTVWAQASQLKQSIWAYAPDDDYNARRQARAAALELQPVVDMVLRVASGAAV